MVTIVTPMILPWDTYKKPKKSKKKLGKIIGSKDLPQTPQELYETDEKEEKKSRKPALAICALSILLTAGCAFKSNYIRDPRYPGNKPFCYVSKNGGNHYHIKHPRSKVEPDCNYLGRTDIPSSENIVPKYVHERRQRQMRNTLRRTQIRNMMRRSNRVRISHRHRSHRH